MKLVIPQFQFDVTLHEDWKEFSEKWNAVKYENEAIGLMHEVASWINNDNVRPQDIELEIIKFFVFYSNVQIRLNPPTGRHGSYTEGPNHACTAQTLLFGKVMPNWKSLRSSGSEKVHEQLLNLIVKPTRPLAKAPFHRFVWSYLVRFQDLVQYDNFYSSTRGEDEVTCAKEVQSLFPIYVQAMINWEFADDLINLRQPFKFYRANEIKSSLEKFYLDAKVDFGYLFGFITHPSRGYIALEKRQGLPDQYNLQACVFIALMGIRFLVNDEPVVKEPKGMFD